MKLEDQVCSLELAKRLKELGIKQNFNLFYYVNIPNIDGFCIEENWPSAQLLFRSRAILKVNGNHNCLISAFTVAELGSLLPESWRDQNIIFDKIENAYSAEIIDDDFSVIYSTEAQARAKMLIFLLENKLMEVPK